MVIRDGNYIVLSAATMASPGRRTRARGAARSGRAASPVLDPAPHPPALADRDGLDDRVIGADGGLRGVMHRVAQVAGSTAPVLILGETGSGKEVIARAIHAQSSRSSGPFIRVNCGAVPAELIDSELFGHERGSFTGATATRLGWFEQAHGGTLLLDEIGELSLAAQVRLLRVLQDGVLQRVGGERPIAVDVRVVAATHRDLAAMVERGRFREDLWYRLAVFPIALPPLREHRADIPAMAEHFARRAASRFGVPYRAPGERDLVLLAAYDWPGNVRELAAVIDRAVLLGEGARLDVARALGGPSPAGRGRVRAAAAGPDEEPRAAPPPRPQEIEPLDDVIRAHIERSLAATFGRVDGPFGAARLLRINPHTLRARMRKLGVDWRRFRVG
jgi:transcriptional regulator with GAF, ATPase, and Fis domain